MSVDEVDEETLDKATRGSGGTKKEESGYRVGGWGGERMTGTGQQKELAEC